jgi:VanZ family protein
MPSLNQLLHEARWRRHWQLLLLVFAAISAYFAFVPVPQGLPMSLHDKINHLAAFAAMGLAAALAQPASWRHTRIAAVGLLGYGAFIELVQSLLPSRTADAADLLADALGVAAGLFLVAMLRRMWQRPKMA